MSVRHVTGFLVSSLTHVFSTSIHLLTISGYLIGARSRLATAACPTWELLLSATTPVYVGRNRRVKASLGAATAESLTNDGKCLTSSVVYEATVDAGDLPQVATSVLSLALHLADLNDKCCHLLME